MTNHQIIADYPAYTIVADKDREFVDGDVIAVPYHSRRYGAMFSFYTLGSVAGYAARYDEDPAEAVEKAKANGHKLYWANANGVSLTAWGRPKETVPGFEIGETIRFAGKSFTLKREPNNNVGLVEAAL